MTPAGRLVAVALCALACACGDDGGTYEGGFAGLNEVYAQQRCETLVDDFCLYLADCGVIDEDSVVACAAEARLSLGCQRAVDTQPWYSDCIAALRDGSCGPAEQGQLPSTCVGVILLR